MHKVLRNIEYIGLIGVTLRDSILGEAQGVEYLRY